MNRALEHDLKSYKNNNLNNMLFFQRVICCFRELISLFFTRFFDVSFIVFC